MDLDKDGKIGRDEIVRELLHVRDEENSNSLRGRLLAIAVLIIAMLSCSNLGTTTLAVWLGKDSKVVQNGLGPPQFATVNGDSGGQIIQTGKASVQFPLSAATAMTIQRLGTVSSLTVTLYLYGSIPTPPFLESGMQGKMQRVHQVVGATKLSSTAVLFSLAEPGQSVLIADGGANLTVRNTNGNVLWSHRVCPDTVDCSAITVDSEAEAADLAAKTQEAGQRRLESEPVSFQRRALDDDEGCMDPSSDDPEALDCECLDMITGACGDQHSSPSEDCIKRLLCNDLRKQVCDSWIDQHCPSSTDARQLDELSELKDAFEGVETFVKGPHARRHGRRLGKCGSDTETA